MPVRMHLVMVMSSADLDPSGYGPPAIGGAVVLFGDVDVSSALRNANLSNSRGDMARAVLHLRRSAPDLTRVDFTSEVVVARGTGRGDRAFTGLVVSAVPEGEDLRVECVSNPALLEPTAGTLQVRTEPIDAIYAILRTTGIPPERMQLEGLERLPLELFEVAAPVSGLTSTKPIRLGTVSFVTDGSPSRMTRLLDDSELASTFGAAPAHAVTYVAAARTFDAIDAGVRRIDSALALINVRLRFANAIAPDGSAPGWSRHQLKQLVSRQRVVAARGQTSSRTWLQELGEPEPAAVQELVASPAANATLNTRHAALRDAYGAAARAIVASDPVTKITAISETLEFYASRADVTFDFTKTERKAIRKAAAGFSEQKRRRVENLIGTLNQVPFMARFRHQLAADGVPMTPSDLDTLKRLRDHRNELVHGRTGRANDADIERAVSIVARILTYASHGGASPDPGMRVGRSGGG